MNRIMENDFYIYLNDELSRKLRDKMRKIGLSKLIEAGVPSSCKALQSSLYNGRYKGIVLRKICEILELDILDIYKNTEYIGYKGNRGRGGGRRSLFSLPQSEEEFESALYVIGMLWGDGTSRAILSNKDPELIDNYRSNLYQAFKIESGKAFQKFLEKVFGYPNKKKSKNLQIPEIVLLMEDKYLAAFLRGIFDSDGKVEFERSSISVSSASDELIDMMALALYRFGIIPIIHRKSPYHILYISGSSLSLFNKYIGFTDSKKKKKLKVLMRGKGRRRVANYLPISPREIKALRLALGLNRSELKIPDYSKYESGSQAITSRALTKIIQSLNRYIDSSKERITDRIKLVNHVINNEEQVDQNNGVVLSLVKDGILEKTGDSYRATDDGKEILNIWERIVNGDEEVVYNIRDILGYWNQVLTSDIIFIKVMDKEVLVGDFDVYDLTVPINHTFIANGIIIHNTTLSDSLLAASGLLSPTIAGEARALDYLEEEQLRGITIKTANISLLHEKDGDSYVINLIDTPGHVDFTGKVTRALRAIDGALVVVDAVEEVMVQTETVTRQALQERVKPILFINKIDRLITELKLGPQEIQKKLGRIIQRFNHLIDIFGEEEYKKGWKVSPEKNNVAFGSAKDRWGFTLKQAVKKGLTFNDVLKYYEEGRIDELKELFPVHEAVLDMVVDHIPNPIEAQKYRTKRIWRGDLDSEIGRAMLNCDPDGPIAFMVTNVIVDERAGLVATGRLLSGTLKPGLEVYLINNGTKDRVLQVGMYMGPYREVVDYIVAGNIPAVLGLDNVMAGETVSTVPDMLPFEAIKYVSEPVVTIAIEPKNTRDLPKLINALRKLAIEDPNLHVKINEETGEYLMSGMGTLHLEISIHALEDMGLQVVTSPPIVVYRETVTRRSPVFPGKSPNKHNRVKLYVERLNEDVVNLITAGELKEIYGRKEIARILLEHGFTHEEARNVWAINEYGNILIDLTKGVQYMQESKQMIIGAFHDFCKEGALAREPVRGVKVVLVDAEFHEDPAHRTLAQVSPMVHRAILGAQLSSEPSIYEPIMKIQVQIPSELIGAVTSVLASKRGTVSSVDQREYYTVVNGFIPVSETFDLAQVLRGATGGRAFWQSQFSHWELVPKSLLNNVIVDIRRRKGLSESPPSWKDFVPLGEKIEA
jgi:elongation factor 2